MWVDYTITQAGDNFKVLGEWDGEVMGTKCCPNCGHDIETIL